MLTSKQKTNPGVGSVFFYRSFRHHNYSIWCWMVLSHSKNFKLLVLGKKFLQHFEPSCIFYEMLMDAKILLTIKTKKAVFSRGTNQLKARGLLLSNSLKRLVRLLKGRSLKKQLLFAAWFPFLYQKLFLDSSSAPRTSCYGWS